MPEGVLGGHPDHTPALGWYCRQDGNCIRQTVAMVRHYAAMKVKDNNNYKKRQALTELMRCAGIVFTLTIFSFF